ncbi:protein DpdE [Sorangium sp. So ce124]|uniref:protein DpdE n=1 Tax=Sorangium sp. So ce124 TaxID=3133280 RepID=UPI003F62FDDF
MPVPVGWKVQIVGREDLGAGEVASSLDSAGAVIVHFYRGPTSYEPVVAKSIRRVQLEEQTRCFVALESGYRVGRVVNCRNSAPNEPRVYYVAFPNTKGVVALAETEFRARSLLGSTDPVATLAALAHETPFFFERRLAWVTAYDIHAAASRGLQALDTSAVELFPHQADAVRRTLQDHRVRYLLADEVGLGKTIEAGAILRQLLRDMPDARVVVLTPSVLTAQWRAELDRRFRLHGVRVVAHEEMRRFAGESHDVVVIDEAQQLISAGADEAAKRRHFEQLSALCRRTRHLLLLSATPVLHRDAELLALLHLLDPDQYRLDDLAGFKRRLERRAPIGRSLLALSRASSPFIIQRQLGQLGQQLADDEVLQAELATAPTGKGPEAAAAWAALAARVRVHVAETWRLHRRMLRTRRSVLVQDGEAQRRRKVEEPEFVSAYLDAERAWADLWDWVEELRMAAAARAVSLPDERARRLQQRYLAIASAVADPSPMLNRLLETARCDPEFTFAADTLDAIARRAEEIPRSARLEALSEVLGSQLDRAPRWVVFCSGADRAQAVAHHLRERLSDVDVQCLDRTVVRNSQELIDGFVEARAQAILVVDESAEAGLNLQAADGLVMFDLPFEPMRLEQRAGRLDRLNRVRPLQAIAILSVDDADDRRLAFDRAWYQAVVHGLGLFSDSIADVPFFLENQLAEMARRVFERGPSALYEYIPQLREQLKSERETAEEQDVLDGTYAGAVRSSSWWKALEDVDAAEDALERAFAGYVDKSVALKRWYVGERQPGTASKFELHRGREHDILLPAERIRTFLPSPRRLFTFGRKRATQEMDVELLRPGHPLLDGLRALADWDDRGRAFALWRKVPGWRAPHLVARVCVRATLDTSLMGEAARDAIAAASVQRLAMNWFATWRSEHFLQADGTAATNEQIEQCTPSYQTPRDTNLGGERSSALHALVPSIEWPTYCHRMAETALDLARKDASFVQALSQARSEADEYFGKLEVHLRLRERQGMLGDIAAERAMHRSVHDRVDEFLARPAFHVDAIGIYVLAADAGWIQIEP